MVSGRVSIVGAVLSFSQPVVLPVGRNRVLNANFLLERDVGPAGTLIHFADDLGRPPTQVVLTIDEIEFPPVVDRDEGNCTDGADNDGDGLVDRDDPDCVVRNGVPRLPRTVVDAVVRQRSERVLFRRGDTDGDGDVNVADAVALANSLVGTAGAAPLCESIYDTNDDGSLDVSDVVTIVEHALRAGPDLAAPFERCGVDETFDQLVCAESNC